MEWEEAQFSPEELSAIQSSLTDAVEFKRQRDAQQVDEAREEETQASSRAFLMEFREWFGDALQPLLISDESAALFEGVVKSLSFLDFLEIGTWMARDGFTLHELTSAGAQLSLYAALFTVSVYKENGERYFESSDAAKAWLQEPGFLLLPFFLRDVIFERNDSLKKVLGPDGLERLLSGPPL
jgi:hypothetical protein